MNRRLNTQLLTLLTIVLFLLTLSSSIVKSVPPVHQETLIVDITGNGDFTSIKEAISNAGANAIIEIKEGTYKENNFEINKKLTIIGDGQTSTIIDCEGNNGFIFNSPYVNIENLKLINTGEYAISVEFDSIWCNITRCTIEIPMHKTGIKIKASSTVVSDCNVIGTTSTGIGVEIRKTSNVINNCNIHGLNIGVLAFVDAYNNEIISCNIFDNTNGVEIRINSHDNIVTTCNIYANELGVYFWQNANYNSVYLNNFWRNDVAASDKSNNTWDDGSFGNYWDQYTGLDVNNDGIGDTPYVISENNEDRYPLTDMLLPEEIIAPSNVKHISSSSNNIPSFTWDSSVYNKGVEGYYVKIDNNPETFIGDTTSWTSTETISNGVHTFYVRAKGNDNTFSAYASLTILIDTTFIDTDNDGWSDEEEQIYGTDPNNPENYPLDTDNDRIPDSVDTDDDNDGYNDDMETSYATSTTDSNIYPTDTDGDGIPDEDSPDGKYTGDVDDDDDYLKDTIETRLGSNPLDKSDAKKIYIIGEPYFLVDTSQNGVYNILYDVNDDTTTAVEKYDGNYLIDKDGDNSWDYIYIVADNSLEEYKTKITTPLLTIQTILIILILIIISVIVLYYFRDKIRNYKPFRKTKKTVRKPSHEKPLRIITGDRETIDTISQTKNLLESIQQDVTAYMEKLNQIEDQISTTMKTEDKESLKTLQGKIDKSKKVDNIKETKIDNISHKKEDAKTKEYLSENVEEKVDELLSKLDKKK